MKYRMPFKTSHTAVGLILGALMVGGVVLSGTSAFANGESGTNWNPTSTERLVKLPSAYLKKALDQDFSQSGLANALLDTNSNIAAKGQTLADLQSAMDMAQGEVKTELRHQFLAEKREYIMLMGERQDLNRKRLQTKVNVYKRVLDKLKRSGAGLSPAKAELMDRQDEARQRFENSATSVDLSVLNASVGGESKYSKEYAKNAQAIAQLSEALAAHPMNAEAEVDGKAIGKQDYMRQLITVAESDMAILDQEESMLGYMAKLVALDAMALAENLNENDFLGDDAESQTATIAASVDFFIQ